MGELKWFTLKTPDGYLKLKNTISMLNLKISFDHCVDINSLNTSKPYSYYAKYLWISLKPQ